MSSHHSESHSELGHIVEPKLFLKILIILLVLTVATVLVAPAVSGQAVNFGHWNIVIALAIATVKATLVLMFFMHLKYENKITLLYFVFPVALLLVLLGGIFIDNPFRKQVSPIAIEAGKVIEMQGAVAPSSKDHADHH